MEDFATVRNRLARTIEDAQPRSQTVMTCSEPSPQTWKACWREPLRRANIPSSAACGYEWITWCSIKVRSTTLADLPAYSDSSRRSCREQVAGKRSGHAWPAQDDFHAAEAVARRQQTQGERIDPVHVTVVGET